MLFVVAAWPHAAAAQSAARGAQLFQELECVDCHGSDAQGDVGPRLAGTRLELAAVVTQLRGPRGVMPVYGPDRLSNDDIASLYAWLQSLPDEPVFPTWFSSELINLATPKMPGAKTLEVHFSHRFTESIRDAGLQGFWGLDSFATPAFWFAYGITDRVQAHGGRSSNRGTWEYGAKVALLDEERLGIPLSVSAVVGGAYLDRDNVVDKSRFTLEVPLGWRVHERVSLLLTPLLATNTDPSGNPASEAYSAALGAGGTFRFTARQSVDFEWVRNVAGFRNVDAVDQWAVYWGIKVGGHVFQIGVGNSVDYTTDQMAAGALALGRESDVRLGFNLVRAFKLGGG